MEGKSKHINTNGYITVHEAYFRLTQQIDVSFVSCVKFDCSVTSIFICKYYSFFAYYIEESLAFHCQSLWEFAFGAHYSVVVLTSQPRIRLDPFGAFSIGIKMQGSSSASSSPSSPGSSSWSSFSASLGRAGSQRQQQQQAKKRFQWDRFDLMLLGVICLYAVMAPFTKVEESFQVQAVHDLLMYGTKVSEFDHLQFPGVVPRSFIGPILVAVPTYIIQCVAHHTWNILDLLFPPLLPTVTRVLMAILRTTPLLRTGESLIGFSTLLSRPPPPVSPLRLLRLVEEDKTTYVYAWMARVADALSSVVTPVFSAFVGVLDLFFPRAAFHVAPCVGCSRDDALWLLLVARIVMGLAAGVALLTVRRALATRFGGKIPGVDKGFVLITLLQVCHASLCLSPLRPTLSAFAHTSR